MGSGRGLRHFTHCIKRVEGRGFALTNLRGLYLGLSSSHTHLHNNILLALVSCLGLKSLLNSVFAWALLSQVLPAVLLSNIELTAFPFEIP